jgi:hypothetical protein
MTIRVEIDIELDRDQIMFLRSEFESEYNRKYNLIWRQVQSKRNSSTFPDAKWLRELEKKDIIYILYPTWD